MEDLRQTPPTTPAYGLSNRQSQPGTDQLGHEQAAGSWAASKRIERTSSIASSDSARLSMDSFSSSAVSMGADARSRAMRSTSGLTHRTRRLSLTARDAALFTASQGLTPLLNAPPHQAAGQAAWSWPFGAGQQALATVPPPIAPGLLPEVQDADFLPYLHSCAEAYALFQQAMQMLHKELEGSGRSQHAPGEGLLAALRDVPHMYFAEDFSLARREVWEQVGLGARDEQELAEHHERAVQHFDACETHFTEEVAARSSHLFEAAGVVGDLRACLGGCYDLVHGMRSEIQEMKENVLEAAVVVQGLQRRRQNVSEVAERLRVLAVVAAALEAASLLVPQGAYVEALDVLDELRAALDDGAVAGLHAFRSLPQQLAAFGQEVEATMLDGFLQTAYFTGLDVVVSRELATLQQRRAGQHSASAPAQPANAAPASVPNGRHEIGMGAEDVPEDDSVLDVDLERLTPLILGLRRTGRLQTAMAACRDMVAAEVKQGIRDVVEQGLPFLLDASWEVPAEAFLTDRLQMLTPGAFIALLDAVRSVTSACLERSRALSAAVAAVLRAAGAQRAQVAEAEALLSLLGQSIADAAQARWTKLLAARAEQAAQGSLTDLQRLLTASGAMADCGVLAGAKPSAALRQALQLQCRAYLDHMHRTHITCLSGLLDQELWVAAEVPGATQAVVDALELRAAALAAAGAAPQQNGVHANMPEARQLLSERLRVGAQDFQVVEGELALLDMLQACLQLQALAPDLGPEIAHRAVELLKVFNSRTCQLVLGAGAMQTTGLKSISAKHLALCCQCLGALIALHPALVPVFTAGLHPSRRAVLVPEYERALQDLNVHHNELLGKFVGIMRERLTASLRQLPGVAAQWQHSKPAAQPQPSAFAATLTKQLRILLQVLSSTLQQHELETVFGNVGRLYSKAVAEAFLQLPPQGSAWHAQSATDLHALLEALEALPLPPGQRAMYLQPLASLCNTRFARTNPRRAISPTKSLTHSSDLRAHSRRRFVSEEPVHAVDVRQPNGLRQTISASELSFVSVTPADATDSGDQPQPTASQRVSEAEELFLAKQSSQGQATGYKDALIEAPSVLQTAAVLVDPPPGSSSGAAEAMRNIIPPSRGDSFAGSTASGSAVEVDAQLAIQPQEASAQPHDSALRGGSAELAAGELDPGGGALLREEGDSGAVALAQHGMSSPVASAPWQELSLQPEEDTTGLSPEVSLGFVPGDPGDAASPHRQKELVSQLPAVDLEKLQQPRAKGMDAATILQRIEQLAQARSVSQDCSGGDGA